MAELDRCQFESHSLLWVRKPCFNPGKLGGRVTKEWSEEGVLVLGNVIRGCGGGARPGGGGIVEK